MADAINAKFDVSGMLSFFDKLGVKAVSLASRMAVEGGVVFRDEAKIRAPKSSPPYNPISRGSQQSGSLANAMYLAKSERLSGPSSVGYSVSWNRDLAWWGHLAEFGWWQTHKIQWVAGGDYFITTDQELPTPIYHPGQAFLTATYEAMLPRAKEAMLARGRKELPILLAEQ